MRERGGCVPHRRVQLGIADTSFAVDHRDAVRRALRSTPPDLGTWHAFRQYFTGVHEDRLWVLFEEDLLPGYAWVFPLPDGRANVGFGVLRGPAAHRRIAPAWCGAVLVPGDGG